MAKKATGKSGKSKSRKTGTAVGLGSSTIGRMSVSRLPIKLEY